MRGCLPHCVNQVNFEKDPRSRYLELLGYDQNDLSHKVLDLTGAHTQSGGEEARGGVDACQLAEKMATLGRDKVCVGTGAGEASVGLHSVLLQEIALIKSKYTPIACSDAQAGSFIMCVIAAFRTTHCLCHMYVL